MFSNNNLSLQVNTVVHFAARNINIGDEITDNYNLFNDAQIPWLFDLSKKYCHSLFILMHSLVECAS